MSLIRVSSNASTSRLATESALLLVAVAFTVLYLRFTIGWTVNYKGHELWFHVHPIRGEQLFIDGVKADKGRLRISVTMRGTIQSGAGVGERITAGSVAALHRFSCRIIAESFVGGS